MSHGGGSFRLRSHSDTHLLTLGSISQGLPYAALARGLHLPTVWQGDETGHAIALRQGCTREVLALEVGLVADAGPKYVRGVHLQGERNFVKEMSNFMQT